MKSTDAAAISIVNLSKRYTKGASLALDNLSLNVHSGEVYGFLGANGAGKSTTIRLLLNFIQPTSGSGQIMGNDIVEDSVAVKHDVGYLAGDVALYDKLTGKEFLQYMADLHPLEHESFQNELVNAFEAQIDKRLSTLSKGNRQKIGIIQALMHEPKVLILDEPTSGLDPLMQEVFFEYIKKAKTNGACVFFSSHNLSEVQRICDRIGFIHNGKLIREQSLDELTQNAAHTFDLIFAATPPVSELSKISEPHVRGNNVSITVPVASLSDFFGVLSRHKLSHFQQREVNLEEEFMNFYREADNDSH